jgi:hypothetical protein
MLPQHTGRKSSVLQRTEELHAAGYIPLFVAALREADADMDEEGLAGTLKQVVLPAPSPNG